VRISEHNTKGKCKFSFLLLSEHGIKHHFEHHIILGNDIVVAQAWFSKLNFKKSVHYIQILSSNT
ncbi:MAG: hypothetical protein J1F25_03095, partial [Prevotellaceae bacterium]|nr:hypothetical protein [Prevotellaceae bacterium]